jgi:cytochrome c-type biogenesis protein CcmH/NrfF
VSRRARLLVSWGLLAVLAVAGLAVAVLGDDPPTPEERVRRLSAQIACPTCAGQSVRNSDAGISVQIRAEIAQRVDQGQTDDSILSFLVQAYGRENLLTPPSSGAASLAWTLPVFAAVVAAAALAVTFRRWRPTPSTVTDEERDLVERARRQESP